MIARVLNFKILDGKVEDLLSLVNEQVVPKLSSVSGIITCLVTHNPENNECVTTAVYVDQAAADGAQETVQGFWSELGPFLAGPPTLEVKGVLLAYTTKAG